MCTVLAKIHKLICCVDFIFYFGKCRFNLCLLDKTNYSFYNFILMLRNYSYSVIITVQV